ncbi:MULTISPECIES: antibiotic biosynthesis monooxygenase [Acidithrix]|uniref:Antibiotic biosynthesis monooxygenase n=1 Tax=Acidithrix ferrooxidans TaxID=1280514 RepID=A0A0D8HD37_9ACTN|nr:MULTISPECIES: antibiotic biosynthesis monooxygenase [Acidithrix]KJF15828.1 antibiotic biosynthesis monooxygenase [Acidithrix ferrooxidans]CAG4909314.1 unnamed protein product [Acidithrix sp. C25]
MAAKVIFDFKFNEGTISEGKKTVGEILVDTRKFDGCLGVEVIEDVKDSTHFVFIESWVSQDHYSAYTTWRAGEGRTNLGSFFAGPPAVTIYETTDI